MARRKPQGERSQLACYIDADVHEAVRAYSDETGILIARIVEDALRSYLKQRRRK